jgi:aminopeptidase 2
MAAMCATRDPVLLQRTFDFAISDKVKSQDINAFFYGLSANPLAKRQVWTFFKDNYTPLLARFKSNPSILGGIVKASFSTFVFSPSSPHLKHEYSS